MLIKGAVFLLIFASYGVNPTQQSHPVKEFAWPEDVHSKRDEGKIEHYKIEEDHENYEGEMGVLIMSKLDQLISKCPFQDKASQQEKGVDLRRSSVPHPIDWSEDIGGWGDLGSGQQEQQDVRHERLPEERPATGSREESLATLIDKIDDWLKLVISHHLRNQDVRSGISFQESRGETELPKGSPVPLLTHSSVSSDKSELEQQRWSQYQEPVSMYLANEDGQKGVQLEEAEDSFGAASAERARKSLLKAADVARLLANSSQNSSSQRDSKGTTDPKSLLVPLTVSPPKHTTRPEVSFLGFGEVQRIEPFNGNGRTQARMSCQFGEGESGSTKNMTISQVEWAKFDNYLVDQDSDPPFDCGRVRLSLGSRKCHLVPVKTNTLVTVHPRPPVQNYLNAQTPSYSVTLHDVNEEHLGVYRCSAVREYPDGRRELVYRVIQFE